MAWSIFLLRAYKATEKRYTLSRSQKTGLSNSTNSKRRMNNLIGDCQGSLDLRLVHCEHKTAEQNAPNISTYFLSFGPFIKEPALLCLFKVAVPAMSCGGGVAWDFWDGPNGTSEEV